MLEDSLVNLYGRDLLVEHFVAILGTGQGFRQRIVGLQKLIIFLLLLCELSRLIPLAFRRDRLHQLLLHFDHLFSLLLGCLIDLLLH